MTRGLAYRRAKHEDIFARRLAQIHKRWDRFGVNGSIYGSRYGFYQTVYSRKNSPTESVEVVVRSEEDYEWHLAWRARLSMNNPRNCSCSHCKWRNRGIGYGNAMKTLTIGEQQQVRILVEDMDAIIADVQPRNFTWRSRKVRAPSS